MKKSEFTKGLVNYILKRDQHLALNRVQTEQLAVYINIYIEKVEMLPPDRFNSPEGGFEHTWEPEDEKK